MKTPNLTKTFVQTTSIQIILGWTIIVAASYVTGNIWLKNEIVAYTILWLAGGLGIGFFFFRYYAAGKNETGGQTNSLIYQSILETSPDSVAVTDLFGNYIYVNKHTALLHGYDTAEEFIGKSSFSFFSIDDVAKATRYMNITRTGGIIKNIEFKLLRKDKSTFPAELSAALVKNEFGIPVAFIAITRDITDRKRTADQLQDLNEQLMLQLSEIKKLQTILHEQAIQDPLTSLYNRRFMEEALKQELARASREKQAFSIVMMDMDNLKSLNDLNGHAIGDAALKSLSKLLKDHTRAEDIVCRFGGDEFLIILHNTDEVNAFTCIQKWSEKAKAIDIVHENIHLQVSFSAGIATYPNHQSIEDLVRAADKALYEAKAMKKKKL